MSHNRRPAGLGCHGLGVEGKYAESAAIRTTGIRQKDAAPGSSLLSHRIRPRINVALPAGNFVSSRAGRAMEVFRFRFLVFVSTVLNAGTSTWLSAGGFQLPKEERYDCDLHDFRRRQ
jgi:hypothetical protein